MSKGPSISSLELRIFRGACKAASLVLQAASLGWEWEESEKLLGAGPGWGKNNELIDLPPRFLGRERGTGQSDKPGVGVRDKTCHPPPGNLVL